MATAMTHAYACRGCLAHRRLGLCLGRPSSICPEGSRRWLRPVQRRDLGRECLAHPHQTRLLAADSARMRPWVCRLHDRGRRGTSTVTNISPRARLTKSLAGRPIAPRCSRPSLMFGGADDVDTTAW